MSKRSNTNNKRHWLSNSLIVVVALVVTFIAWGGYRYTVSTNEQAFVEKIEGTLTSLRNALSTPLWTVDTPSVKQLGNAMLQSELVVGMVVRDDIGAIVFSARNDTSEETTLRTTSVVYEETVVGELQLRFSLEPLHNEIQRDLAVLAAWGTILLVFGLWIWRLRVDMKLRKRTEKELIRARRKAEDANQAKSIFLANMSHELRTPLNAILGFSEMIGRDRDTPAAIQEKVSIINRSGDHLLAMINDVLDLSKIEAGGVELEPETFELPGMLQDIARMFEVRAQSARLRFTLELDLEPVRVIKADVGKLRQILINLLGNAVKFTKEGGFSLRVRLKPIEDDPAMVALQLEVEDSGPGIPPEQIGRIFQPFVQAAQSPTGGKGTGLGLAISRSFVDLMGGDISVESVVGKGSLFRVELPVALAEAEEIVSVQSIRSAVLGLEAGQLAWRILVVEDNEENRLLLTGLLLQAGFEVQEAENGEQAVALFQQWQPHFIWMDMRMPVMDGYEATTKIRELPDGDKVKIVALTASAFKEQRPKILEAGCDDVCLKPYQAHEIFDAMARQLGVNYIYEEESQEITGATSVELTGEMFQKLPPELRQALKKAAHMLDIEATVEVAERVRAIDPAIADGLQRLADDFQFGRIRALLGDTNHE